jgi:soluble lytic murein transglycosylase-like protein
MPRARTLQDDPGTAAFQGEHGSGCSIYWFLAPLSVVLISVLLAALALNVRPAAGLPPPPGAISPIFTPEVQVWSESIVRWSAAASLDPNLAATVMQIESCGDPRATSRSGAIGLFQVMPFHFSAEDHPYDPDTNAARGLAYLARSLEAAEGDPRLALAGYNGGIGVIPRGDWTWSEQTLRYVRYGLPIYEAARRASVESSALTEWFEKYGAGLCRQAHARLGLP